MLINFGKLFFGTVLLASLYACGIEDKNIEPDSLDLIQSSSLQTENLIIVTLDGLRWQEVFKGVDPYILDNNEEAKTHKEEIINLFGIQSEEQSRRNLTPFIWETVAKEGQIYGNRNYGNNVNVSNPYWLSYPGYNEIFTGKVNLNIKDNKYGLNSGKNILSYVAEHVGFGKDKVAAVTNSPKFTEILRTQDNDFFSLIGARAIDSPIKTYITMEVENELVHDISYLDYISEKSSLFKQDMNVYMAAKDVLVKTQPKMLYISFFSTDGHGHNDKYKSYLESINNIDVLLADLWSYLQSDEHYKNKTTLFITVDHGRGEKNDWFHHSSRVKGSDETWFAVIGPDTEAKGEMKEKGQWYQKQFAKSFCEFLGIDYAGFTL